MIGRTSRWLLAIIVAVVIAMTLLGEETFHTEVMIPAPPADVWAVLMDTERYPEWNPVFVRVDGAYSEGGQVTNLVQDPSGPMEITATVAKLTPEVELNQTGGMFGLLTFDHQWLLEPADGGTKVIQHEVDRGLYMWFWDSSWVQPGYESVSQALKERVLSLAADDGGG